MLGIHTQIRRRFATPTPALFLDRDGVIVDEVGYLHRTADVRIIRGSEAAISRANAAGRAVIVVTNQAGIARGYYDWTQFEQVQTYIEEQLGDAQIDGVWACGYHPDAAGPLGSDHDFRKPNPGMILDAASEMNIDLAWSWLVGDKAIDIEAAIRARLAGAVLVLTGYGRSMQNEVQNLRSPHCRVLIRDSLSAAVDEILNTSPLY